MTKELLQQAHDALITSLAYVDATSAIAEVQGALKAIEQALAQQEQPAQEVSESWTDIVAVNLVREGVNKHKARELAAHFLTLFAPPTQPAQEPVAWYLSEDSNILGVEWSRQKPKYGRDWTPLYKTAPTQPALSDAEILNCFSASKAEGMASYMLAVVRAIEAHCRGGNHG